jgi:hypothetical protein
MNASRKWLTGCCVAAVLNFVVLLAVVQVLQLVQHIRASVFAGFQEA